MQRAGSRTALKLKGDIGELYVLRELRERGYECEERGGQAGCDIYLPCSDTRIEVRTSLLKNEGVYPPGIEFFGWRVQNRDQGSVKKFDILVCVALSRDFSIAKYYIFTHKEAFSVGNVHIGRFNNVKKKIHLFKNMSAFKRAIKSRPELVTAFERRINRNPKSFQNKWMKIG